MKLQKDELPRHLAVLITLAGLLFLFNLGNSSLWDSDEPKYGEAAWEMLETGNWLVPHFNKTERFDKPPFFYWCIATSYMVFGFNEFATRFPAAIFGIGCVILTYFLGRLLFSPQIGLLGGIILATSFQFFAQSRLAVVDTTLTFFLTCTIYGLSGIMLFPEKARYYFYAALGMAMAVITKGPIGILLPALIGTSGFLIFKPWNKIKIRWVVWSSLLFITIALPWYSAILGQYGKSYSESFFLFHNIIRFIKPVDNQSGPWYFYFMTFPLGFFPWIGFIMPAVAQFLTPTVTLNIRKELKFLGLWFITIFLFFSLAATKLPNYILPLFPAVALLMATAWTLSSVSNHMKTLTNVSFLFSIGFMLLAARYIPYILQNKHPFLAKEVFLNLVPPGIFLLCILLIAGILFWQHKNQLKSFYVLSIGFGIFVLMTLQVITPHAEAYKPAKALALAINNASLTPNDQIVTYKIASTSLVYYTRHQVVPISSEKELKKLLLKPERVFVLLHKNEYDNLRKNFLLDLKFIAENHSIILAMKNYETHAPQ